jgi:hypothetical protein
MKRLGELQVKLVSDCFSTFLLHIDFCVSPSLRFKDVQSKLEFWAATRGRTPYFSMHRLALDRN